MANKHLILWLFLTILGMTFSSNHIPYYFNSDNNVISMKYFAALLIAISTLLAGCTTTPPKNINNACAIIQEYPGWYYDMLDTYHRWGVPISVQLAIIRKESHFVADARPPMQYTLGFIPSGRASTAYGYAQALDGTWADFQRQTNQPRASRTNFSDASDFVGWYADRVHRKLGIPKSDAYNIYLAYHQGIAAYRRGSYLSQPGIMNYAQLVQNWAFNYAQQLQNCKIPPKPFFRFH